MNSMLDMTRRKDSFIDVLLRITLKNSKCKTITKAIIVERLCVSTIETIREHIVKKERTLEYLRFGLYM